MILFFDVTCPAPYDRDALARGVLGGTEGTVVRVAEDLGATHDVAVFQHNRAAAARTAARWLVGDARALPDDVRHVVLLRNPLFLPFLRRRYPAARLWFWLHDHPGGRLPAARDTILAVDPEVVTVSDYHARITRQAVPGARVRTIHNPIDDALVPDGTPVDPLKLVFLSARERGLADALKLHQALRAHAPFELHVVAKVQPGEALVSGPGVIDHGPLPHAKAVDQLRGALCLFYPNHGHPETFGLVMAEANAVGTPALVHDFGASREVTAHPDEVLDARDGAAVIARVLAWHRGGRPQVTLRPSFRRSAVLATWREALS